MVSSVVVPAPWLIDDKAGRTHVVGIPTYLRGRREKRLVRTLFAMRREELTTVIWLGSSVRNASMVDFVIAVHCVSDKHFSRF